MHHTNDLQMIKFSFLKMFKKDVRINDCFEIKNY